jgi:hypothetical protein
MMWNGTKSYSQDISKNNRQGIIYFTFVFVLTFFLFKVQNKDLSSTNPILPLISFSVLKVPEKGSMLMQIL